MKDIHLWFKTILYSAMPILLASCASTYIPTDSSVGNMSVKQARNVLGTKLNRGCTWGYKSTRISNGPCEHITKVRVTSRSLLVTHKSGKQSNFIFSELPQISKEGQSLDLTFGMIALAGTPVIWLESSFSNDEIVNALYVLKQNAIKDIAEYDSSFTVSLADYRKKAASNATLPEEANKYKVQAEGAVRDKEFDDAADLYAAALKIAPWWPAGHFNRALLLGETGDYEMAKREMKHYLLLVPDAPNARAAQDKIYEWERLETK